MGKAGGYAIQGKGAVLIEKIEGDFYAIWGLSIVDTCEAIKEALEEYNQL